MSDITASITFDDLHGVPPNLQEKEDWCVVPPPIYKPDICVGVTLPEISSVFRPHRSHSEMQRRREILGLQLDESFEDGITLTTPSPPQGSAAADESTEEEGEKTGRVDGTGQSGVNPAVVRRGEDAETKTNTVTNTTAAAPTNAIHAAAAATHPPIAPTATATAHVPQHLCFSPYHNNSSYAFPRTTATATAHLFTPETIAPISAPPPAMMCCYFKQQGWCKMNNRCWYAHEGTDTTPCHYGSACQAGHSHFTTAPPLARVRRPQEGERAAEGRNGDVAVGRAGEAAKSRFTIHHPCSVCGAAPSYLLGRRIPVWSEGGQGVSMCVRASCGVCGSSYLL